jgi:hypothetical protein
MRPTTFLIHLQTRFLVDVCEELLYNERVEGSQQQQLGLAS